ncbi:MAG: hypothetical protein NT145_04000 [Elusimicrobia bacterium]|nr:hypothetical protein [Elusimicrobiota bacterium]
MIRKAIILFQVVLISVGGLLAAVSYPESTLKERENVLAEYKASGGKDISWVNQLLFDNNNEKRNYAANYLCGETISAGLTLPINPKNFLPLLYSLEKDPSWLVRNTIADKIWKFGSSQSILNALKLKLDNEDYRVIITAAKTYMFINPENKLIIEKLNSNKGLLLEHISTSEFENIIALFQQYGIRKKLYLKYIRSGGKYELDTRRILFLFEDREYYAKEICGINPISEQKQYKADVLSLPILIYLLENDPDPIIRKIIENLLPGFIKEINSVKILKKEMKDNNAEIKICYWKAILEVNPKEKDVISDMQAFIRKTKNRNEREAVYSILNSIQNANEKK